MLSALLSFPQELQHPHESPRDFICSHKPPLLLGEQALGSSHIPKQFRQSNPLVEPGMKCYILKMSREITGGTSVNATESL